MVDPIVVGVVKVEESARYLVIIEHPFPLASVETAMRIRDQVAGWLRTWWEDGAKFGTLVIDHGVHLRLERIEGVEGSDVEG